MKKILLPVLIALFSFTAIAQSEIFSVFDGVGASYSGEAMVSAARNIGFGKAYVALSPGSFSEESMKSIDRTGIPWFFVKSVDEIALMKDVFADIRTHSKTARILEVSGKMHATSILSEQTDVEEMITLWFKYKL